MDDQRLVNNFRKGINYYIENAEDRRLIQKPIVAFFPLEGGNYKHQRELMVVGRSPNGWLDGEYTPSSLTVSAEFDKMWEEVFTHKYGPEDPMALIRLDWNRPEAPFCRSAFFRVAKGMMSELNSLNEDDEDWSSYLVWSNLFKIAPWDGGNPKVLMKRAQKPWCYEMLEQELMVYQPKRVLFMTGSSWADPFLEHLNFEEKKVPKGECIELCGKIELVGGFRTNAIVIPHPQSKLEQEPIEQATECFRQLMSS